MIIKDHIYKTNFKTVGHVVLGACYGWCGYLFIPTKVGKGGREWGGGQQEEDRRRMGETGWEGDVRNKK